MGTRIIDEKGDDVKLAIEAITWKHRANALPAFVLQLSTVITPADLDGKVSVETRNPITDAWSKIASIRFADGTEWTAQ